MNETFWLSRGAISFGVHLGYIALILITEALAGALFALFPLVLMPLFVCVFGFFYSMHLYRRSDSVIGSLLCTFAGLILAGILHFIADWAINGLYFDIWVLLYNAVVLLCLLLGCVMGIRGGKHRKNQRRSRSHE